MELEVVVAQELLDQMVAVTTVVHGGVGITNSITVASGTGPYYAGGGAGGGTGGNVSGGSGGGGSFNNSTGLVRLEQMA